MPITVPAPFRSVRDLTVADLVGDGGEGVVHDVAETGLGGAPLVFKRYTEPVTGDRRDDLAHLVALRPHLHLGMSAFAWPESLVTEGPHLVGVLFPRAPDPFWADFSLRSGRTERRLREAQYLLFAADKLTRLGVPFATLAQRLEVLSGLLAAVALLHHHGLVYGDVSARNLLYRTDGGVGVFLLDCDGIVEAGTRYVIDSPDWHDPSAPAVARPETDVYKVALLAARLLAVNPTTRHLPERGGTPAAMAPTFSAALSPDPAARPTIDELAAALGQIAPGPAGAQGELPTWGLRPGTGEVVMVQMPPPITDGPTPGRRGGGLRGWLRRGG